MENAVSELEILDEGFEDCGMVSGCCTGGTGSSRK